MRLVSGRTTIEKDTRLFLGKSFESLVASDHECKILQPPETTRNNTHVLANGLVDSDFDFQNESILNLLNPRKSVKELNS